MTPLEIAGLIVTFMTAMGALISALSNRRSDRVSDTKAQAEAEKTRIDGQSVIIEDLCTEVKRLIDANADLAERVGKLEKDYALLQRKYNHVLTWATPKGYQPPASW